MIEYRFTSDPNAEEALQSVVLDEESLSGEDDKQIDILKPDPMFDTAPTGQAVSECEICGLPFNQVVLTDSNKYTEFKKCPKHRKVSPGDSETIDSLVLNATIEYEPHAAQQLIHESPARFKVINAGSRFGKDRATTMDAINYFIACLNEERDSSVIPSVFWWIIAPTERMANQNWKEFKTFFPKELVADFSDSGMVIETVWGGRIEVRSAYDPESLVGVGLDIVTITEAARIANMDVVWANLEQRLNSPGRGLGGKGGIGIINSSPRGRNYFYRMWTWGQYNHPAYDPDWESWSFSTWDNPYMAVKAEETQTVQSIALRMEDDTEYTVSDGESVRLMHFDKAEKRKAGDITEVHSSDVYAYSGDRVRKKDGTSYEVITADSITSVVGVNLRAFQGVEKKYKDRLRERIGTSRYMQDIEAQFVGGDMPCFPLFNDRCIKYPKPGSAEDRTAEIKAWQEPKPYASYVVGYDPAKTNDHPAVVVVDRETGYITKVYDLFNLQSWTAQYNKLAQISRLYNFAPIAFSKTGHETLQENLEERGLDCIVFNEQGSNKENLVNNYEVIVENGGVQVLIDGSDEVDTLIRQHNDYSRIQRGNSVSFGNVEEPHDDFVDACYVAFMAINDNTSTSLPFVGLGAGISKGI